MNFSEAGVYIVAGLLFDSLMFASNLKIDCCCQKADSSNAADLEVLQLKPVYFPDGTANQSAVQPVVRDFELIKWNV
jgi:hypothetical protein